MTHMNAAGISHFTLSQTLQALRVGVNASDLHGSLCGYLCAGGLTDAQRWMNALALEIEALDCPKASQLVLEQLYTVCCAQLDAIDFSFEPLLPEPALAVEERASALVEWCRGFLGGFGLAGTVLQSGELSADANDILRDFGTIAASGFEYADAEEDETALTEVVEFIRVGVMLLHAELSERSHLPKTLH